MYELLVNEIKREQQKEKEKCKLKLDNIGFLIYKKSNKIKIKIKNFI
jgi:hypothetical protein